MPRNNLAAARAVTGDVSGGDRAAAVQVFAPARLHLGFLDLDGAFGRRFGGLGLAIEGFGTRLTIAHADKPAANGAQRERALAYLAAASRALGLPEAARIDIGETSPEHAGFGSGTQLGLAVAAGLARLHDMPIATPALAATIGRGARSGIGIGAFDQGGFIVDGGVGAGTETPPIIARLPFPRAWRILLLLDRARQGLHGPAERAAFAALPPFGEARAGGLCRLMMLSLLPGIAEADFPAASAAIGEIQAILGDYFSGAQKARFSSPAVSEALAWLEREGIAGIGQSSWGPTGFAWIDSAPRAEALAARLRKRFSGGAVQCRIVEARNRGAEIAILHRAEETGP